MTDNFRFSDEHFPSNGKPPAAFFAWDKKRQRAWWRESDQRKESVVMHNPASDLADKIKAAKQEHKRRAGNGAEGAEQEPPKKEDEKVKEAQAAKLIKLARESTASLFHTADNVCYADVIVSGHRETWAVRSKGFKRWLCKRYYEANSTAPSSEAIQSALNMTEAYAHFDGKEMPVHVRVASLGGYIFLDLCDPTWRAVEISASGWEVVANPPVRFKRPSGMKPLPAPVPGGDIEALRPFLNIATDNDFILLVAWLLAALRDCGPFPVLVLAGEHGTAKSTLASLVRALIDPNTAPLRALPREDRDLFIAATNAHALVFDNVSGLPTWISDTLCRLATGGGFATRQLYTDGDEQLFDSTRPIILNGIEDIVARPDLADRSIFLTLEPIPDEARRTAKDLWKAFNAEAPRILGALLDGVSRGVERLPTTVLDSIPRMADFAVWATACEEALWPDGTFMSAYLGNIAAAIEGVVESDPVASALRAFITERHDNHWKGTAGTLLLRLSETAGDRISKAREWPTNPKALSGRLRRVAPMLRQLGVIVKMGERAPGTGKRLISVTLEVGESASQPSHASQDDGNDNDINDEWA